VTIAVLFDMFRDAFVNHLGTVAVYLPWCALLWSVTANLWYLRWCSKISAVWFSMLLNALLLQICC